MSISLTDVIRNVLVRWTGLRMAVDHQMGGVSSRQKANYLITVIEEALKRNSKMEFEDLEDILIDYMDSELNTIFEDESTEEIAKTLLSFLQFFNSGNTVALEEATKALPYCEDWLSFPVLLTGAVPVANDSEVSSDSENETQLEPMDCEWTTVSYKKNR